MNQAARMFVLAGLAAGFSSCSGGGGGGSSGAAGGLYVQSCSLSCSNGQGGAQVSCGLINTFQNQDVALIFNDSISAGSVNSNTFQVVDAGTGSVPPGSYVIQGNRVAFRPRLTFDSVGNPIFGFVPGGTYQIKLPGTAQGDLAPYVTSTAGKANQSRVQCSITTDQGLIDAVPGPPQVTVIVTVRDGLTSQVVQKKLDASMPDVDPAHPLPVLQPYVDPMGGPDTNDRVLTTSDIVFVFNDLMNLGTVVIPALAQAPFITIKVDTDGDINTNVDQQAWTGSYQFCAGQTQFVDQTNLRTCTRFIATSGLPSAGTNPANPRRVVVDVPNTVRDLKGNGVANADKYAFVPEAIVLPPVVLPAGGERFTSNSNLDQRRSGAYWGADVAGGTSGQLQPGQGGGSGRMGDLMLSTGTTTTFHTSPVHAQARVLLTTNLKGADAAWLRFNSTPPGPTGGTCGVDLQQYCYLKADDLVAADPTHTIKIQDFIGDTLRETAVFLNLNAAGDPEVAKCRFWVENNNELVCEYKTPGTVGNGFGLSVFSNANNIAVIGGMVPPGTAYSTGIFTGGVDYDEFGLPTSSFREEGLLTNVFNATEGGPIQHYFSDDGIFEFASIEIQAGATLRFVGDNPARLFARGRCVVADTALIDVSGLALGAHISANPIGQVGGAVVDASPAGFHLVGARGGPGGGHGGTGANRAIYPYYFCNASAPPFPPANAMVCLPNAGTVMVPIVNHGLTEFYSAPVSMTVFNGVDGDGVGGPLGYGLAQTLGLGRGRGGSRWPINFPTTTDALGDLATTGACKSEQVAAPGSGGAYSTDGTSGTPAANTPSSVFPAVTSNTAPPATAGQSSDINLTAAGRALSPDQGFLRGGSGGGGGGSHVADTTTTGGVNCFGGSTINVFRDHSGAGGGGGGGVIQIAGGRKVQIDGKIDATGGDGGDVSLTGATYGLQAVPGGGGAGGGILLQGREIAFGSSSGLLDIVGGLGGSGNFGALGGDGGNGLVRVEDRLSIAQDAVALKVNPIDPTDPFSSMWLSVDTWVDQATARPDSYSGAQSCFMQVTGSFFALTFNPDDLANPDPTKRYGWDMELVVDLPGLGLRRVNYRNPAAPSATDPNTGIPGHTTSAIWGGGLMTSEQHWGNCIDAGTLPPQCTMGGAPVIVRFQGARAAGVIVDPCNVDVNSLSEVQPNSLTPWVMHSTELNNFLPAPDMVRFQIVFDRSHPEFSMVRGITNVFVNATPD